jgi:hypothetical protein
VDNLDKIVSIAIKELIASPLLGALCIIGGALGVLLSGIIVVGIAVGDLGIIQSMRAHV